MVFHRSLSDSKSPQVSRTRLRILAVLSNAVVWIVSTRPPTSKSSRPFNNPLVIVPKTPITIGTIVTFIFHSFFNLTLLLLLLLLLFYSFESFYTNVSWWFLTGIQVTASFLKSPGLFLIFWPIIIIMFFECFIFFLLFPYHSVPLSILWWLHWAQQLQLVSSSLSCPIAF